MGYPDKSSWIWGTMDFLFLGKGALIVPVSSRKGAVSSTTVTQNFPVSTTVTLFFNNSYTEAYPLQN